MAIHRLKPPMDTYTGTLANRYVFIGGLIDLSGLPPGDEAKIAHFLNLNWGLELASHSQNRQEDSPGQPWPSQVSPDDRATSSDTQAGGSGLHTPGGDTANPETPQFVTLENRIRAAVRQLDPYDDSQWTQGGLPRIDYLVTLLGTSNVTRQDVSIATNNLTRDRMLNNG